MSLVNDAKRLAEAWPIKWIDERTSKCRFCHASLWNENDEHYDECPVLGLPQIVAALEAAERLIPMIERMGQHHQHYRESPRGPYAPPGSPPTYKVCEHYCASWPCIEKEMYDAAQPLVDALRGAEVTA